MKLLWLGDFYYDYDYISNDIEKLSKWIKDNDYKTILNLEGSLDSGIYTKINKRGPNLSSNIISIEVLKKLNVVGVSLANNHMMDFGEAGLLHTIRLLDDNNILHTGAGKNLEEALKPMVITDNKKQIAIYSFGWDVEETVYATKNSAGCAPRDKELITNIIKDNSNEYDKSVVCLHWGFEYNRLPMPYDIELGHSIIDSGADLIIGNHPHCIQPKEIYKQRNIYYALGNFYFGNRRKRFNRKFKEGITNQSDYGIGVVTDFNLKINQEVMFFYNKNKNETNIINGKAKLTVLLENLLNYDIYSKKYVWLCKKRKLNFNPILTKSIFINRIKIKKLYVNYKLRKIVKSIVRKG